MDSDPIVVPFLKWAGGKRWLVSSHPNLFPQKYKSYLEPFLGSGAVYFHLRPQQALLSDVNTNLIGTYKALQKDWKSIRNILNAYNEKHCKEFYYETRSAEFKKPIEKAAQFIYLNRTCWNGLYRVNLKGQFNVPIGTKEKAILKTDNFQGVSESLKSAELISTDFENIIDSAEKNDFVFVDPPYTVKHNLNGFVKYNDKLFTWNDQIRLRDCIENAVTRGAKVLLTNADHKSIHELYKGIGEMKSLSRASVISGDASARGRYSELIVKCYKK